jgi:hypothetical protein
MSVGVYIGIDAYKLFSVFGPFGSKYTEQLIRIQTQSKHQLTYNPPTLGPKTPNNLYILIPPIAGLIYTIPMHYAEVEKKSMKVLRA